MMSEIDLTRFSPLLIADSEFDASQPCSWNDNGKSPDSIKTGKGTSKSIKSCVSSSTDVAECAYQCSNPQLFQDEQTSDVSSTTLCSTPVSDLSSTSDRYPSPSTYKTSDELNTLPYENNTVLQSSSHSEVASSSLQDVVRDITDDQPETGLVTALKVLLSKLIQKKYENMKPTNAKKLDNLWITTLAFVDNLVQSQHIINGQLSDQDARRTSESELGSHVL